MSYPIYVLSKGRAGTCTTPQLLWEAGLKFTLVMDSQEEAEIYHKAGVPGDMCIVAKPGQGLGVVREEVRQNALSKGALRYWTFDDDIRKLIRLVDEPVFLNSINPAVWIKEMEDNEVIKDENFALASPAWVMWSRGYPKKTLKWNKMPSSQITIINPHRGVAYRPEYKLRADMAFWFDNMLGENKEAFSLLFNKWTYRSAGIATGVGGNQPHYHFGLDVEFTERVANLYPGMAEMTDSANGDARLKIDWPYFHLVRKDILWGDRE